MTESKVVAVTVVEVVLVIRVGDVVINFLMVVFGDM